MTRVLLLMMTLLAGASHAAGQDRTAPVYVTLWFDTEDYILPQDDEATKRLAEMLTRLGVRATFKIVGEKARVLESRGRADVIAALRKHDIGYHSNTHSQQPTVAVYLQNAGLGRRPSRVLRAARCRASRDVERIFGVTPVAYGQPGSAWAPQAYPALRDLGIQHVPGRGRSRRHRRSAVLLRRDAERVQDAVESHAHGLERRRAASTRARRLSRRSTQRLRANGGGTISIYYHPNEFVQTEFWDAVNFRRGANPDRADWKQPGTRPAAETEQAFRDFEQYIRFIKAQPGVRFATATELKTLYEDAASSRTSRPRSCRRSRVRCRRRSRFRSSSAMRSHRPTSSVCSPMRWRIHRGQGAAGRDEDCGVGWTGAGTSARRRGSRSSSFRWSAFARSGSRHRGILSNRAPRA